jgi:hypothetical protein
MILYLRNGVVAGSQFRYEIAHQCESLSLRFNKWSIVVCKIFELV